MLKNTEEYHNILFFLAQIKAWDYYAPLSSFNILKQDLAVGLTVLKDENENRTFSC